MSFIILVGPKYNSIIPKIKLQIKQKKTPAILIDRVFKIKYQFLTTAKNFFQCINQAN